MGGQTQWTIAGTAQVTGLNPQNASTTVIFTFQRKAKGGADWNQIAGVVQQTTNGVNGTASFDTGQQSLPPPAQGDQYRVAESGYYLDGTGNTVNL